MDIKFSAPSFTANGHWALPIGANKNLTAIITKLLGKTLTDTIKTVLKHNNNFTGDRDQFIWLHGLNHGTKPLSIVLYGTGATDQTYTTPDALKFGGLLLAQAKSQSVDNLNIIVPKHLDASNSALGAVLRGYQFADYKTKDKDKALAVKKLTFYTENAKQAQKDWPQHSAIASGIYLARDVMNQPPNVCTPAGFVKTAQARMKKLPVTFRVLDKAAIAKLGMGAIQAVSRGNRNDAYVLIAEYNGKAKSAKAKPTTPLALVGKGVTFDTGGYNLKPGASMVDMKYDMGGAAAVIGTVMALAEAKAPVNVVGIVGLTENMIDEDAYLPSEIITTLSGQTVEVIDTDAEGRLVLADLLTYVQRQYKPNAIIDIATLTGAVLIALGTEYAGVLGHHDDMVNNLIACSQATGEKCWRLPLDAVAPSTLKSQIADMINVDIQRYAGASFAGYFLSQFIENKTPWVHIDIAGFMRTKTDTAFCPAGAMGYGVRLLVDYATKHA